MINRKNRTLVSNNTTILVPEVYGFEITIDDGPWSYFELVDENGDVPCHLSFRPDHNTIVGNQKNNGNWQRETQIVADFSVVETVIGNVEIHDETITVFIIGFDGIKFSFPRDNSSQYTVNRSSNVAAKYLQSKIEKCGDIARVAVGSFFLNIDVVKSDTEAFAKQFAQEKQFLESVVSFAQSRVLPKHVPILVSGKDLMILAPLVARLYPSSQITVISGDYDKHELIKKTSAANGIPNPKFTPLEELSSSENFTDLLLIGRHLISDRTFGEFSAKTDRLHLCTAEDNPVPLNHITGEVNQQLGEINVVVDESNDWQLTLHRAGQHALYRPGLDIVVAMYNAKDYILECVHSLLTKDRPDVRVIVVDDGSKDNCAKLVREKYAENDRVQVVTKANGGCASARNYGRLLSDASHITFVDADDFVDNDLYGALLDLAAYSGYEIVQGGFDFFDASHAQPYTESYEQDLFKGMRTTKFGSHDVINISAQQLIHGQPTIWRRIYRRDFLEMRNIYFPENIRAYDDYIFHLISITHAKNIWMVPALKYFYRQHPAQDIKQGDERHFYELYMFRLLLQRSIVEGWPNFLDFSKSIVNTLNWSSENLRRDLRKPFLDSGARICAGIEKIYGPSAMPAELLAHVRNPEFMSFFTVHQKKMENLPQTPLWAYIDAPGQHPETLKMTKNIATGKAS